MHEYNMYEIFLAKHMQLSIHKQRKFIFKNLHAGEIHLQWSDRLGEVKQNF